MISELRQTNILSYLKEKGSAGTQDLCRLTGSSVSTLRRDLNELAEQGLIRRAHGGAVYAAGPDRMEPASHPLFTEPDPDPALADKTAIAKAALDRISSGDTIFIGAGMTCNLLCRYLREASLSSLHIVTTNVSAVYALGNDTHFSILLLGGSIHFGLNHIETLDQYTLQNLRPYYFDKSFFTVDGADAGAGYSIINREQLPLYHHLLDNSRETWLLLDRSKFDKRTFTNFCSLDRIPNVITNAEIPEAYARIYREAGVQTVFSE